MAIAKTSEESKISIRVVNGTNATGGNVYKTMSFSNVKPTAPDQDIYDVGFSLAGLQSKSLVEIIRADQASLISE